MTSRNDIKRTVIVASKQELLNEHYYRRLWIAARNMEISSRDWLDEIADAIYEYQGAILQPNGQPWPIPDVDDVLGCRRRVSMFLEALDNKPRRITRITERARLFDLYFRIKHPHIARHFGR